MTWLKRYQEQACAWRKEAHAWATHGRDSKAQQALDIATVYDALAEEEEKSPLRTTRAEVLRSLKKDPDPDG